MHVKRIESWKLFREKEDQNTSKSLGRPKCLGNIGRNEEKGKHRICITLTQI